MAKEIEFTDTTGQADYANVLNATGQWYNTVGAAFENFNAANWSQYKIAATEYGSSGVYEADMPSVAAASYNLVARRQAGGSPAQSDTIVGTGSIDWTGAIVASAGLSLPAHAPGGTDGLLILGTNTAGILIQPNSGVPLHLSGGSSVGLIVDSADLDAAQFSGGGVGLNITGVSGGVSISAPASGFGIAVTTNVDDAIHIASTSGRGISIDSGDIGLSINSSTSIGMAIGGGTDGLSITGVTGNGVAINGNLHGIICIASTNEGAQFNGGAGSAGMTLNGGTTGPGLSVVGGSTGGSGIVVTAGQASGNGSGLVLTGRLAGTGADLVLTNSDAPTLANAIWSFGVDTVVTAAEILRGLASFVMGLTTGGGVGPVIFRDLANTKNRINMTVDALGNRTAITTDLT